MSKKLKIHLDYYSPTGGDHLINSESNPRNVKSQVREAAKGKILSPLDDIIQGSAINTAIAKVLIELSGSFWFESRSCINTTVIVNVQNVINAHLRDTMQKRQPNKP